MGRRENAFRGYLVRIRTKDGRVLQHRSLRMVLDKSHGEGITLNKRRLVDDPSMLHTKERALAKPTDAYQIHGVSRSAFLTDAGMSEATWRVYPARASTTPRKAKVPRHGLGIEESGIDEFIALAKDDVDQRKATARRPCDTLGSHLYRQPPASPYQAVSLDSIRDAEPLYTVRHVTDKSGRGTRTQHSAATPAPLREKNGDDDGENAQAVDGLRSALSGWEDAEGQAVDGRQLWSELEDAEYECVVMTDDDLASMTASWVELESDSRENEQVFG